VYKEFLAWYSDELELPELHGMALDLPRSTARGHLATVWVVEKLPQDARTFLEYLAFLDPDCIQAKIFINFSGSLALMQDLPQKKGEWLKARDGLLRASLVHHNEQEGDLRIHQLLQDIVRAEFADERQSQLLSNFIVLLNAAFPKVSLDKRATTKRWPE